MSETIVIEEGSTSVLYEIDGDKATAKLILQTYPRTDLSEAEPATSQNALGEVATSATVAVQHNPSSYTLAPLPQHLDLK